MQKYLRTLISHSFIFTNADFDAEIIYQFKMAHIHLCQSTHKVEENKMDEKTQTYYYSFLKTSSQSYNSKKKV